MKRCKVYLGLDAHVRHCVLAAMDEDGQIIEVFKFPTSEIELIKTLRRVEAKEKYMALEECSLAAWMAQVARPYVTEVLIADPRENALISRNPNKGDTADARNLCRLLRLGELKRVYHAQTDARALFKAAAQHYCDLRDQQVALKQKIKAMYRHWGLVAVGGERVYSPKGRNEYLNQVAHVVVQHQLGHLYHLMDETERQEAAALQELKTLGRSYPEIREFKKIPGIGPIGALMFDAIVQTAHRFADHHRLWRYSRLGVTDRCSDGTPLGYKRLDRSGNSELKNLSYWAWMSAMRGANEVRAFYKASLQRTHDNKHARLNTQRKILAVMLGLWKKGGHYRSELFLGSSNA